MKIIPAIDIISGRAVRLEKGDYNKITEYSENPVDVAKVFYNAGATELHVVDLDGAKTGRLENLEVIRQIINETKLNVEVGGGIRNEERIKIYLDCGAKRIIIGTAAAEKIDFAKEMASKYGQSLMVGVDTKDSFVATRGWINSTKLDGVEFCKTLASAGVKHVIYTDVSKDGMLSGTNMEVYKELSQIRGLNITASGGITSLEELSTLKSLGIWGAILGKALYAGKISMKEVLMIGGSKC
ncbi:MAG: 1-(5-phosphoribosyl)-5-[(5-phosphoribosylamino)methylideneamino]imidazole-4-carboxamide isomerase [Clostridiales bacterium]|jgi:phosphoribosylformimino-5-aminoimidazole carboxamide ribotide isomerase|nr:1-(5-phosphoribosyl)-5-[(5-phosphoribosylamino)methylideneamino]imidazole-4-carboxamide isomerase [Clostridiales bacterium]